MKNLKSRVKKLEQSRGVNTPHKLMIFEMYRARRSPTDAEIEALRKTLKGDSAVLWNGERFFVDMKDYKEADNPLTDAELAERNEKILAEIRAGL
jgi:hypothetical protein